VEQPGDTGQQPTREGVVRTHRDLVQCVQRVVGDHIKVVQVHPHPRLSRMTILWAGRRQVPLTRRHFKSRMSQRDRERGKRLRARAKDKWSSHSGSAAEVLDLLHWRAVRRVVGVTPWASQLLLRLKHHALSAYDPVSAGLHCPHASCLREGRVNLYHVFWDCAAAKLLLLYRWTSVGLRIVDAEKALFSLTLPTMPIDIMEATGKLLSLYLDDTIGGIGDTVGTATAQ
jgi:hypothetical protein